MGFIVHAADISHPTKVWDLHSRWTDGLVDEFFRQVRKQSLAGFRSTQRYFIREMLNENLVFRFRRFVIGSQHLFLKVKLDSSIL